MEAVAKTRYLKGSPQKARLVIDLVRGKNVADALAILKYTNKRAARPIAKCIRSAVANATYSAEQQNIAIDPDELWVKRCFVDMGPTKNRRRLRPAPQGRAYFERRHYCHITIELTSEPLVEEDEYIPSEKKRPVKKAKAEAPKAEEVVSEAEETVEEEQTQATEEAKAETEASGEAETKEANETEAVEETTPEAEESSDEQSDEDGSSEEE